MVDVGEEMAVTAEVAVLGVLWRCCERDCGKWAGLASGLGATSGAANFPAPSGRLQPVTYVRVCAYFVGGHVEMYVYAIEMNK